MSHHEVAPASGPKLDHGCHELTGQPYPRMAVLVQPPTSLIGPQNPNKERNCSHRCCFCPNLRFTPANVRHMYCTCCGQIALWLHMTLRYSSSRLLGFFQGYLRSDRRCCVRQEVDSASTFQDNPQLCATGCHSSLRLRCCHLVSDALDSQLTSYVKGRQRQDI